MQNSPLRNKSDMLIAAADLLHDKCYYPAVAHAAYYSCYQLLLHIWLHSMNKSQDELDTKTSQSQYGSHKYLLDEVLSYISNLKQTNTDIRCLRNGIKELKRLRVEADYLDKDIDYTQSKQSIELSKKLLLILKRY